MTGYLLNSLMYEGVGEQPDTPESFPVKDEWEIWRNQLASAPQLPAIGFKDGEEGVREYEHGYQILRSIVINKDDIWKFTDRVDFYQTVKHGRRIVAIPLKQPKEASTLPVDIGSEDYPTYEQAGGKKKWDDMSELEKAYYNLQKALNSNAVYRKTIDQLRNKQPLPSDKPESEASVNEAAKAAAVNYVTEKHNKQAGEPWYNEDEVEMQAFVAGYAFAKGTNTINNKHG